MKYRFKSATETNSKDFKLSFIAISNEIDNIELKIKMYDIDSMLKQNDHLAEFLKTLWTEKIVLQKMKNFENRINFVEAAS